MLVCTLTDFAGLVISDRYDMIRSATNAVIRNFKRRLSVPHVDWPIKLQTALSGQFTSSGNLMPTNYTAYLHRFLPFLLVVLSPTIANAAILLEAQSAGLTDAGGGTNFARLYVDGVNYSPNQGGINVVVLDELTGDVLDQDTFTGWNDYLTDAAAARAEFANYVDSIQDGRIVMVAVRDDGWISWGNGYPTNYLDELSLIMQSIGGSTTNMTDIGFRGSYALIGVKGGGVGTGVEAKDTRYGSTSVSVSMTLDVTEPVPEPSSLLAFAGLGVCLGGGAWLRRGRKAA